MATHEGEGRRRGGHNKTEALAATAAASLPFCFIDPSGVSQVAFLTASAGTVVGVTAHGCKAVSRRTKAILVHHREKRETPISSSTDACKPVGSDGEHETTITNTRTDAKPVGSDGEHAFTQLEFEECIRKLASSLTGVVISGTMSIVLPHLLVGTALNAVETACQWHRLRKMTQQAGGGAGLARNVSKLDVSLQITAGICIKLLTSVLFLGQDFDVWVDGMSQLSDAVVTVVDTGALPTGPPQGPGQTAQLAKTAHGHMIDHGLLAHTTALANAPTQLVGDLLGDGTNYTPLWGDNKPFSHWAAMGVVSTATETGLGRVIEEPIHMLFNEASRAGEKMDQERNSSRKAGGGESSWKAA